MTNIIISGVLSLISAIILFVLKFFSDKHSLKTKAFSESISDVLMLEVLIPFQKNIELNLFKVITLSNNQNLKENEVLITDITLALEQLYYKVESDYEIFSYTSETLLCSLKQFLEVKNKYPHNIKKINKAYRLFSSDYLIMINKVRKGKFLPERKENFRIAFSLYPNKNLKSFKRERFKNKTISNVLFVIVVIPSILFAIVSTIHFAVSFYDLIFILYKITE